MPKFRILHKPPKQRRLKVLLRCDQWRNGLCASFSHPVYCPKERATYAGDECCHHPKQNRLKVKVGKIRG